MTKPASITRLENDDGIWYVIDDPDHNEPGEGGGVHYAIPIELLGTVIGDICVDLAFLDDQELAEQDPSSTTDIDGKDVSVWIKPEGYYVMLSFNRGERTFVLGFTDAERLGSALVSASKKAGALLSPAGIPDELFEAVEKGGDAAPPPSQRERFAKKFEAERVVVVSDEPPAVAPTDSSEALASKKTTLEQIDEWLAIQQPTDSWGVNAVESGRFLRKRVAQLEEEQIRLASELLLVGARASDAEREAEQMRPLVDGATRIVFRRPDGTRGAVARQTPDGLSWVVDAFVKDDFENDAGDVMQLVKRGLSKDEALAVAQDLAARGIAPVVNDV